MKPLTISFEYNQRTIDIIVKEDQRIDEVIQVLTDNHVLIFTNTTDQIFLRSWRLETIINSRYTFKQANIENGDVLQFITEE